MGLSPLITFYLLSPCVVVAFSVHLPLTTTAATTAPIQKLRQLQDGALVDWMYCLLTLGDLFTFIGEQYSEW